MYQLLLIFVILLYVLILIPAALGTSYGIREKYAQLLIQIFKWGAAQGASAGNVQQNINGDVEENGTSSEYRTRQHGIIMREKTESIQAKLSDIDLALTPRSSTVETLVDDCLDFIAAGIESIIEDEVTSRFKAEQLASWNLLTRTGCTFEHISWKLTLLWFIGGLFRYLILVPIRVCIFIVGVAHLIVIAYTAGFVKNKETKKWLNDYGMKITMRIMCRAYSAIIRYHDREYMATKGGICVANHTSPTDILILSCDNSYAMVGQLQGGVLGFLQNTLSKATQHVWFNRADAEDRKQVLKRLQEHVDDPELLPIIIFPEGTCINNTSVMMFKKGSFEVSSTIYPIAIKYDSRLGDAFWNSSEQSYGEYLFRMMTSWAIMCDVWYLPPMTRNEGEDSIDFARRVKHAIAVKGGLLELEWDGMLKRMKVPAKMVVAQQKRYWERLSRKTTIAYDQEDAENIANKLQEHFSPAHVPKESEVKADDVELDYSGLTKKDM